MNIVGGGLKLSECFLVRICLNLTAPGHNIPLFILYSSASFLPSVFGYL